jgi:hypothetical protein
MLYILFLHLTKKIETYRQTIRDFGNPIAIHLPPVHILLPNWYLFFKAFDASLKSVSKQYNKIIAEFSN